MSTPQTVKSQIQSLIDQSNMTTGKSDTNLTDAVDSLIKLVKLVVAERFDLKAEIDFTDGKIVNSGLDTNLVVGAYKINDTNDGFDVSDSAIYTTGMSGDKNGAIVINHNTGVYAVVEKYDFGTADFTISTWIKFPKDYYFNSGDNNYLFGIDHPGTTNGFAIGIKKTVAGEDKAAGIQQLRFQTVDNSTKNIKLTESNKLLDDTWYNLVLVREGVLMRIYLEGVQLETYTIPENYDFNTADLAFGGYYGRVSGWYQNTSMYYDNIQVYATALSSEEINKYILNQTT